MVFFSVQVNNTKSVSPELDYHQEERRVITFLLNDTNNSLPLFQSPKKSLLKDGNKTPIALQFHPFQV